VAFLQLPVAESQLLRPFAAPSASDLATVVTVEKLEKLRGLGLVEMPDPHLLSPAETVESRCLRLDS